MKTIITILLATVFLANGYAFSQTDISKVKEIKITQMTVMVIPFTGANEDIRTVLDGSFAKRAAVTKVQQEFDKRGFPTIDFLARLKALSQDIVFTSLNNKDAKAKVIESTATDLIVEVDVNVINQGGDVNVAKVPVKCYDASSAFILGTEIDYCLSRPNSIRDTGALVLNALKDDCMNNFLASMNSGFALLKEKGRPMKMLISPSSTSKITMLSKASGSGKTITRTIFEWLEEHTVNSNYVNAGSSELYINLDDVRIPLLDSKNKNYRPYYFGDDFITFLNDQKVGAQSINAKSEIRNGTIYITIN